MKLYLSIADEPGLHKIVVASAVLHILFIFLVSLDVRTKDRIESSYLVNLVTPVPLQKTPETPLQEKPLKKIRKPVKLKTEKKTAETIIVKKREVVQKKSPAEILRQKEIITIPAPPVKTDNKKQPYVITRNKKPIKTEPVLIDRGYREPAIPAKASDQKKRYMIARNKKPVKTEPVAVDRGYREPTIPAKASDQKQQYMIARNKKPVKTEPVAVDRGYREPAIPVKADEQKQQYMINRDKKPVKTEPVAVDRGYREPAIPVKADEQKQQYMINRDKKPVKTEPVAVDRGYREPAIPVKEDDQKQQYMIARNMTAVQKQPVKEYRKTEAHVNSDRDVTRTHDFDALEQKEVPAIIEKAERKIVHRKQDPHIKRTDNRGFPEHSAYDSLDTPGIEIQGVPLDKLSACTTALDERIFKKKILKIIDSNRGCYNPATGKYVFIGTGRFTSFDMIIFPASGRELSNRCEELKNAFICLTSIKE